MTAPVARRRDALVVRACLGVAALQAAPPVLIAWGGYGPTVAADAVVVAVSSPVLLGVAAFGAVVAVALGQPGLQPAGLHDPVRHGAPPGTVRTRLRWAALAALLGIGVTAAAVVVDGGVRGGAAALTDALDDGSAVWTFVLLVVQGGFIELRAPVAFGVAWFVLSRASRPVRPRSRRRSRWSPAARTRRRSPGSPSPTS